MKFNEKAKHITCGVVMGAMLATAVPATAAQVTKSISVAYNNIKIVVDGQQVSTDKSNEPFIYNGTTYLPIRAVGQAVGKQVSWDGRTNTVYLGNSPVANGEQYLVDVCPPYEKGSIRLADSVVMQGKSYLKTIWLNKYQNRPGYALFNLDGQYETLEFDLGHVDNEEDDEILFNIYLDGALAKTYSMTKEERVTHYVVNLDNALQMKIEVIDGYGFAMANCTVK